ncbi:MIB/HERC2 domain-containing protein [Entamoeba marina]
MSLTEEQKEAFKIVLFDSITNFSKSVDIPLEKLIIQVLPLTIRSCSDYLKEHEEKLKIKLQEYQHKTETLANALKVEKKIKAPKEDTNSIHNLLGKRVTRGPDWKWGEQDGGEGSVGKVTSIKGNGWAKVVWDKSRNENRYRWGVDSSYDLKIVEEIDEVIPEFSEQIKKNQVRGYWKWGDQDGGVGSKGVVKDGCDDNWVEVKWSNGSVLQYRWGAENCYDLEVVSSD